MTLWHTRQTRKGAMTMRGETRTESTHAHIDHYRKYTGGAGGLTLYICIRRAMHDEIIKSTWIAKIPPPHTYTHLYDRAVRALKAARHRKGRGERRGGEEGEKMRTRCPRLRSGRERAGPSEKSKPRRARHVEYQVYTQETSLLYTLIRKRNRTMKPDGDLEGRAHAPRGG